MLKLESQLCFPLYACAKEIVRRYNPLLEPLGLTYTQYIAGKFCRSDERTFRKDRHAEDPPLQV